jgi:hypothetical protein
VLAVLPERETLEDRAANELAQERIIRKGSVNEVDSAEEPLVIFSGPSLG